MAPLGALVEEPLVEAAEADELTLGRPRKCEKWETEEGVE